jgi:MerR family transcriptional regulator, light-induced transcriptional regulator
MNLFSISQLSKFSGIKQHTIRMWEQRYKALTPDRSEGNTRYYDNAQLRRLLNIVSLMDSDYKVSELCAMPDKKLFQLVDQRANNQELNGDQDDYFIAQLIKAGMSYNEAWFEKIFSHCVLRLGIRDTYTKIIYPMLVRIGLMWASDAVSPSYEHFISNIIRKKLFTAIDALPPSQPEADTWLLFLPEDEFHEIGLLLSSYLIQRSGRRVIYLGANIPLASLNSTIQETAPSRLLSFFVHRDALEDQQAYLEEINNIFPSKKVYISASLPFNDPLKTIKKFNWLHSVEDLERELL